MALEAIKYAPGKLLVLDQLQLPHKTHFDEVYTAEDAFDAIKSMRVRGAPAIAIVAALGLAVELEGKLADGRVLSEPKRYISDRLSYLVKSRPTAVNLSDAARKLQRVVDTTDGASATVIESYIQAARKMLEEDVETNKAIGRHGADWILKHSSTSSAVSIITHCNTGSLATAGYGTALGVIRAVHERGSLERAFCTETRPYNQGSRLTAYELVHDQIPATLITDSMAATLMRLKGKTENIAAVVVGADRVAANGDTANKIGTYALALLAKAHGIKFLVAAPRTTIDMSTASGEDIKIEERPSEELTTIRGPIVRGGKTQPSQSQASSTIHGPLLQGGEVDLQTEAVKISIAAEGVEVWNPAFDVTPAELIDGIVTEVGVAEKGDNGSFQLADIMKLPVSNGH